MLKAPGDGITSRNVCQKRKRLRFGGFIFQHHFNTITHVILTTIPYDFMFTLFTICQHDCSFCVSVGLAGLVWFGRFFGARLDT